MSELVVGKPSSTCMLMVDMGFVSASTPESLKSAREMMPTAKSVQPLCVGKFQVSLLPQFAQDIALPGVFASSKQLLLECRCLTYIVFMARQSSSIAKHC